MNSLLRSFIGFSLIVACTQAGAGNKIYRWQDERNDLTNYAAVPPDNDMGSESLKVYNPEIGISTDINLPVRALPATDADGLPPMMAPKPQGTVIAGSPSIVHKSVDNTDSNLNKTPSTASSSTNEVNKPITSQPRILSQGNNQQLVSSVDDVVAHQKISAQVEKIEENIKTAQRVAEEKRLEEMRVLAERVRNGAATRKEIAALVTYRQTASFGDARSAMALPAKVRANQKQLQFE